VDFYRRICQETLEFIRREMTHPQGGFYSSLDADSEGEEGKYYIWTPEEIRAALPDQDAASLVTAAYGITAAGNFEGSTVLQRVLDDQEIAVQFNIPLQEVARTLDPIHNQLLEYRQGRIRPGTDDKVLVSWNALMSIAFAEAGRYLNISDYTQLAARNLTFLLQNLLVEGRLLRAWREGQANHNAFLEDYAALILALLALYQSDPDAIWFQKAVALTEEMVLNFRHPTTGFYDTRHDHETLIFRPKDTQDNATPSGNALAAKALLQMSALTGNQDWRLIADQMLKSIVSMALTYPTSFGQWLSAMDYSVGPVHEVALLGDFSDPRFQALQDGIWSTYRPRLVVAQSPFPPESNSPPLLNNRSLLEKMPTAYVCQDFVCQLPVTTPEALMSQLQQVAA
jgi:uncharacterized protein YyaL (SSP411 family)